MTLLRVTKRIFDDSIQTVLNPTIYGIIKIMEKVIIILGPTATHKTKLSIYLAEQFPVEIISADSMQFYKGMDIGTDKVNKDIQKRIPHHLIDIVTVQEEFSIAAFKKYTVELINAILKRNKFPLIVGGSGLYIRSITEGFPVEVSAPPYKELREELSKKSLEELRKMAESIDKDAAARIGESDRKRLIRVIEFFRLTGQKISTVKNRKMSYEFLKIGLIKERTILYKDIEKRVEKMFDMGFIDEVRRLKEQYPHWSKTALQAIGYKEVLQFLNGEITIEQAKEQIKKRTRHLAKKQVTWFKKEKDVHWIDTTNFEDAKIKAKKLLEVFLYGNTH